ncbi:MAG: hypothetical protein ACRC92_26890 [Peptostreptococcaceae bacterium]
MKLISKNVTEYDIQACNANVLLVMGVIDKNERDRLISLDRQKRQETVGLMIRSNPVVYNKLKSGIDKYVELFLSVNSIQDYNVIERANDAVWIDKSFSTSNMVTQFDEYIKFIPKRTATTVLYMEGYDDEGGTKSACYYNSSTGEFFQRGFGANTNLEDYPFFNTIKSIMKIFEFRKDYASEYILKLIKKYKNNDLDSEVYKPVRSKVFKIGSASLYYNDELHNVNDTNLSILYNLLSEAAHI